MKALNVSRVSTEEQKEAGNSLPAQFERIDSYCKKKGFDVVKPFSFDESAYKEKRDEFDKLLEFVEDIIKKEKIAVCFDKVDRLSRSVFDKRVARLYELAVADQKQVLLECLNKNHLYVNYSDINDTTYKVSTEDKKLNKLFYGE